VQDRVGDDVQDLVDLGLAGLVGLVNPVEESLLLLEELVAGVDKASAVTLC